MSGRCDVIDHEMLGDAKQAVAITLDPGEQVIAASRTMLWMSNGIEMQGGAGAVQSVGIEKGMDVARRLAVADQCSTTIFANVGPSRATVAFGAPYPGQVVSIDLALHGGQVICQKDAFLCAAGGTDLSVAYQKRLATGLFGADGFVLQKACGRGMMFGHAGGSAVRRLLGKSDALRIHPGCIVAFEATVQYEAQVIACVNDASPDNSAALFVATLTGPGLVYLQTLPLSRLADRISSVSRQTGWRKDEE